MIILLALMSLIGWGIHHSSKVRWAREQALPQIGKLIERGKTGEAYALAVQAERYIPADPTLARFWPDISWSDSIITSPPGASVYRRNYNSPNAQWEFAGLSPILKGRFPAVDSSWKFELQGYTTLERATFPSGPITVALHKDGQAPSGMVPVEFDQGFVESDPFTCGGLQALQAFRPCLQSGLGNTGSISSRSPIASSNALWTREVTRSRSIGNTNSERMDACFRGPTR